MKRIALLLFVLLGGGLAAYLLLPKTMTVDSPDIQPAAIIVNPADLAAFAAVETKLRALAQPMPPMQSGDWLMSHQESGQTFAEYVRAGPVRRRPEQSTIYICEVGTFTPQQAEILAITYEYLRVFFDVPVKVHKKLAVADIPAEAQRRHPRWGDHQLDAGYILHSVLKPDRPADALAYTAFTANDLWPATKPPERPYNFVFGQASLSERVGVWSMYRLGDPAKSAAERLLCLRRMLGTATHETGHILTMTHCTAFACNMCGANSNEESDRYPLNFCPVCLRKLCWNLGVDPVAYLQRLETFCVKHELTAEAEYYRKAVAALVVER